MGGIIPSYAITGQSEDPSAGHGPDLRRASTLSKLQAGSGKVSGATNLAG